MGRFEGRTIIVTGAASGIGAEAVRLFLDEGARVVGADVQPGGIPDEAIAVRADVSDAGQVRSLVADALEVTGVIDVLCNNAGIGSTSDPMACEPDEWDRVFAVNARGVFLGTKFVLPHMVERGVGVIVNTASVAGLVGFRNRAAYCASKGAVVAFTRAVALEYADRGVRCNCVCPGTVDSPWVGRLLEEADDAEVARAGLVARQPMGRLGEPAEIAHAIAYLASDDAAFMTGEALVIDGGITAG